MSVDAVRSVPGGRHVGDESFAGEPAPGSEQFAAIHRTGVSLAAAHVPAADLQPDLASTVIVGVQHGSIVQDIATWLHVL